MKTFLLTAILVSVTFLSNAQNLSGYLDSLKEHRFKYVNTHEVVKSQEERKLIQFFEVDTAFKVVATFEKINDVTGFKMPTSQKSIQRYYRYGKIHFTINGTPLHLFIYQSIDMLYTDDYKDYLFIPFTDATNGSTTYEGGRYIDILIKDIVDNTVTIDFNKAYNPYCCYASGYHCPIPPKENDLNFSIKAGEKKFKK